jgi:hypothetical protein
MSHCNVYSAAQRLWKRNCDRHTLIWQDGQRLTKDPLRIDGKLTMPERPGLGIELDMGQVEAAHRLGKPPSVPDDAMAMQYRSQTGSSTRSVHASADSRLK